MSIRVEVTEQQWVDGLREADYVVLDLAIDRPRPWLEEAIDQVELIGRVEGPVHVALGGEVDDRLDALVREEPVEPVVVIGSA